MFACELVLIRNKGSEHTIGRVRSGVDDEFEERRDGRQLVYQGVVVAVMDKVDKRRGEVVEGCEVRRAREGGCRSMELAANPAESLAERFEGSRTRVAEGGSEELYGDGQRVGVRQGTGHSEEVRGRRAKLGKFSLRKREGLQEPARFRRERG